MVFSHDNGGKRRFPSSGSQLLSTYILFYLSASICLTMSRLPMALPLQGEFGPDTRTDPDILKAGAGVCRHTGYHPRK